MVQNKNKHVVCLGSCYGNKVKEMLRFPGCRWSNVHFHFPCVSAQRAVCIWWTPGGHNKAGLSSSAGFSGAEPFLRGADNPHKWFSSFPDGEKKLLLPN